MDEYRQLAELMRRVTFPVPQEVFLAWEGSFYNCASELAVVTYDRQVLLIQRPDDDPFYAGQWHLPGSIILPGSNRLDTLKKVIANELGIAIGTPEYLDFFEFSKTERPRGQGFCFLHRVFVWHEQANLLSQKPKSRFFSIDDLPKGVIKHHIPMVEAVKRSL